MPEGFMAYNISEIDLSDREVLRRCLSAWEYVEELSYDYPKVKDLKIEIEDRLSSAGLREEEREAIRLHLFEGRSKKETGSIMGISGRLASRLVEEALSKLAEAS